MYHLPDDVLSLRHAAHDASSRDSSTIFLFNYKFYQFQELQLPYTMGQQIHDDPYHLPILRSKVDNGSDDLCTVRTDEMLSQFTRHIEVLVRECLDELTLSLDDLLGRHCNGEPSFGAIMFHSKLS